MKISAIGMARAAARALLEKKGEDVLILGLGSAHPLADYFVLASASSRLHAQALSDAVLAAMKGLKITEKRVHGRMSGSWVLLDYGAVVVHVFLPREREFYDLEGLWDNAKEIPLEEKGKKLMSLKGKEKES